MDINSLTGKSLRTEGISPGVKTRDEVSGSSTTPAGTGGPIGESVTLTDAARSIGAARDMAGAVPFDESKVAALKAALDSGSYKVDTQRLAGRIMTLEGQFT